MKLLPASQPDFRQLAEPPLRLSASRCTARRVIFANVPISIGTAKIKKEPRTEVQGAYNDRYAS